MNRMLRLLCAAACLLLLLAGCGKKEIEPPEFYQIGDDQAITLDTCLGAEHENGKLASITEPAEDASAEVYSYTYEELTTLNATLQEYVAKLKAEDQGFVEAVGPETDMVFLCQPNNPTGRAVPRPLLERVLERCRAVGALLVVDECFCDFLDDPGGFTMTGLLGEYGNLLVLKAFTKLYAMAGLRLGYCVCGDAALLDAMRGAGQPWAVSGPAQAAGIAALRETQYVQAVRALVARERPRLAGELSHKERGEWEQAVRWAQEALEEETEKAQPWEDYLKALLDELDANTSPLRTADIPPMLAERWAWNTPETVEPPFGLPTEDEWEYLCSGGVHTLFPWGDTLELEPIYNEELDNAEKLMRSNPDSALSILDAIDPSELELDSLQAKYHYLRGYIHLSRNHSMVGDSLIRVAHEYYRGKDVVKDVRSGMVMAWYKFWAGDTPGALFMLDSLSSLTNVPDSVMVQTLRARVLLGASEYQGRALIPYVKRLHTLETDSMRKMEARYMLLSAYEYAEV